MILLPSYIRAKGRNPRPSDRHVEDETVAGDGAVCFNEATDQQRFRLISIDAVHAPEGCAGADWLVYRIAQGGINHITGYRRGSLDRVSADVRMIVDALNVRWESAKIKPKVPRRSPAAALRQASDH